MKTISAQSRSSEKERDYFQQMDQLILDSVEIFGARNSMDSFAKYASRQSMTRFLARHRIFNEILNIHGSIIECGVYMGQGLMQWAQMSAIYEPVGGVTREIFGFDTFSGFPSVSEKDTMNKAGRTHSVGDLAVPSGYENLQESIRLYDMNRFLAQFPKVHLIKGDFMKTSESFFQDFPHVIPALLYLDFDLYEPTKKALEMFYPRMPKGSIIAFDESNDATWPGETQAIYEVLDIKKISFQKISFDTKISFCVI
jgi:hypothetical protein